MAIKNQDYIKNLIRELISLPENSLGQIKLTIPRIARVSLFELSCLVLLKKNPDPFRKTVHGAKEKYLLMVKLQFLLKDF